MVSEVHFNQPIEVRTRGGRLRSFEVRPGRGTEPHVIARLYNSVINPEFEAGLKVRAEHIDSRLYYDHEAVLVGLLDGQPSAFINLVKLRLDSEEAIPRTHQALTADDMFTNTRATDGNYWFCPWVGVEPTVYAEGWRAEFDLGSSVKPVSLGQMMVLAVKTRALADGQAEKLFAYSRPSRLRWTFEKERSNFFKDLFESYPLDFEIRDGQLKVRDEVFRYALNAEGIFRIDSLTGSDLMVRIADQWQEKTAGKKHDPVFQFHGSLGARFTEHVFPHGQVHDRNSLGYRTVLQYPLER